MHARGSARLEIEVDPVSLAKGGQLALVRGGEWRDVAQYQCVDGRSAGFAVADRELDLRQSIADRQGFDERAQLRQQRRDPMRQHEAARHVSHEARFAFVETNEHAAFSRHVADRQSSAMTIAPRRPMDRRQ